jgi:D-3-phosphoglycerate dehydrogenase
MKIIGYDPFVNEDMFSKNEIEIVELDSLTSRSDYISVHVPLNDNTKDLFNLDRLRSMKPSARIINVARGGIINEEDLSKALRDSEIAGAAIDVFTVEPIDANHPLVGVPNILLSPHLGASTSEAREGVSRSICEQVRDYLLNEKLVNAVNIPIANLSKLNEIKSFLDLSELLGRIQSQIIKGPIKKVFIECQGTADEIKLISLAFLKGVLQEHVPDRINYINAETIAKELGLEVLMRYSSVESNYNNLISSIVTSHGHEYQFDGSVFDDHNPRLVNVLGREMEVLPKGTMLFIENNDVPGVIGSVGTFLGSLNINIAAYLLNRNVEKDNAFAVIRLDNSLNNEDLINLKDFKDIQSVKQINVEYSNKTISF